MNGIGDFISTGCRPEDARKCGVYPDSVVRAGDAVLFLADGGDRDLLAAVGCPAIRGRSGTAGDRPYTLAECSAENAAALRELLPYTAPSAVLRETRTFGVGDRLGIAGDGHIRVFERFDAFPVFAQQSIRELNLTNRTFTDVLDAATWAVFRNGFRRPWGADGDHVKTADEVEYALKSGYTMITLDCSEHIRNDAAGMTVEQLRAVCSPDPALEDRYLGKTFRLEDGIGLEFDRLSLLRMARIYGGAIDFAAGIYADAIKGRTPAVDFEISIDETLTPTSPAQHFFVANELLLRGVKMATVAPRFCGEFQKGVDYRGDLGQFERELAVHAAVARHFGYKLSIHSGSDKFAVFALIGQYTKGNFHVKTAGTNWLEAMKLTAEFDPALYREVHGYALGAFGEAAKYYHVSTDLTKIPALSTLSDADLPGLFAQDDARQLIHITYGLILNAKDEHGAYRFRDRLYALWRSRREEYAGMLDRHIGHHLELLYSRIGG